MFKFVQMLVFLIAGVKKQPVRVRVEHSIF
jgi:hypothetical protein